MNTILILKAILVIAICLNLIRLFIKARKIKNQVQEQNEKDRYNDYHLGDITHYDIPENGRFIHRSDTPLWSGRTHNKSSNNNEKKINKNPNEKLKKD